MSTSLTASDITPYRGRFAPSPTGPLHAGSLVAALASFLDAKRAGGAWVLRIDDIDPPRAVAGSVGQITEALSAHGLHWDGAVRYQSQSSDAYHRALQQLAETGTLFRCRCTRSTLSDQGTCGQRCEQHAISDEEPHSLRVNFDSAQLAGFADRFQGMQPVTPEKTVTDFIVRRRDGLFAYQLAAAVDDAQPHFTHIVRGADLLDSTHRQRWLMQLLGQTSPCYGHIAVIRDIDGNKLSKQNGAPALDLARTADNLRDCLTHLCQPAPPKSARENDEILDFAIAHWTLHP